MSSENEDSPEVHFTLDRELYERLLEEPFVIEENYKGQRIHISEDFRSVAPGEHRNELDAWGPVFDTGSELDSTKCVASPSSKTALLEGCAKDTIRITEVVSGMRAIPERFKIVRRTNTYFGPQLWLQAPDDYDGPNAQAFRLTCPGPDSHPVLWKGVTSDNGGIHSWSKVAKVQVEIFNVAGYDMCESCGEPIKSPMHRSAAMMGACNGGFSDE